MYLDRKTDCEPRARASYYEKFQKCYFKVSGKIEKMHACISYVDTYLCIFWHKKDA
jgi:hypothetical protein